MFLTLRKPIKIKPHLTFLFQILRSHVMVRVGGGWDTLQNYPDKHDPCRCRRGIEISQLSLTFKIPFNIVAGHRSTLGAHMSVRTSKSPMAVGVTYDRYRSRHNKQKISLPKSNRSKPVVR